MTKINEAASLSDINFLVTNGLGKDQSKMAYYVRILQDPNVIRNNYAFVPYAAEIFSNIVDIIFSDPVLYNRLRSDLVNRRSPSSAQMFVAGRFGPKAYESLNYKSQKTNIPLETLIEVYNRGYAADDKPPHLNAEQNGFNRVNSFIAEGRAAELDKDLPRNREMGTESPTKIYKNDTPKQKTLSTIKRIIKK